MIDPGFLAQLDRFDASLERRVDALFQGRQRSHDVGEGQTFSDYRTYAPGDDVRLLDWKVLARTDELYVKQYEAERELTVHVLVDASASMDFGAGDHDKFEFAAKLGLGFAYLAADERNDFRFSVFDGTTERLDAGASTRGEVLRVVELLNETDPGGEADFRRALESYAATIDSRSLVFVASDFLGDPDEIEAGLAALGRNEVVLGHVVAPEERNPPARGETVFEGIERAVSLRTYFGRRLERRYRERFEDHVDDVAARAEELGVDHAVVDTGLDFFDGFTDVWVG